jgi:hypothetical protein
MARNRREGRPEGLDPHPLVEKLSDEAGQPQNTITLHGYPGQAPGDGEWLLWLSLAFTDSVQGRDEDIVHAETLRNDQGTILYLRDTARLQYRHVETQTIEASFLGGGIASRFTAPPDPIPGLRQTIVTPSLGMGCLQAVSLACVSRGIACTIVGCDTDWNCQTAAPFHCWTSPFVCRTEANRCFFTETVECG